MSSARLKLAAAATVAAAAVWGCAGMGGGVMNRIGCDIAPILGRITGNMELDKVEK